MQLICVQCGNSDFEGMDVTHLVVCPVPGCGYQFDPMHPDRIILRDAGEESHSSVTAKDWLAGWEEETAND